MHILRFSIIRVIAPLFIGCMITAASTVEAQQLWTGAYVSRGKCSSHTGAVGPESHSVAIQGHKWPHPKGSGIEFIDRNARGINAFAAGRGNNDAMRLRLLNAARSDAFTKLDFGGAGGSSPSFVTAIVVESVAYAVGQLRSGNTISSEEIKELDGWVQKLLQNAPKRSGSPDHEAAIPTARLLWAAAIGDKKQFSQAYREMNKVLRPLRSRPYFSDKVRVNNEVFHQVVHAAIVLYRNGIDVFSAKDGKYSLHDAIAYHANAVRAVGAGKVQTTDNVGDQARSIMRATGWGTHLAWIPLYLSHFPKSGAAAEVRALNSTLRSIDRNPYWGQQIGIHSDCLYGRY